VNLSDASEIIKQVKIIDIVDRHHWFSILRCASYYIVYKITFIAFDIVRYVTACS